MKRNVRLISFFLHFAFALALSTFVVVSSDAEPITQSNVPSRSEQIVQSRANAAANKINLSATLKHELMISLSNSDDTNASHILREAGLKLGSDVKLSYDARAFRSANDSSGTDPDKANGQKGNGNACKNPKIIIIYEPIKFDNGSGWRVTIQVKC